MYMYMHMYMCTCIHVHARTVHACIWLGKPKRDKSAKLLLDTSTMTLVNIVVMLYNQEVHAECTDDTVTCTILQSSPESSRRVSMSWPKAHVSREWLPPAAPAPDEDWIKKLHHI